MGAIQIARRGAEELASCLGRVDEAQAVALLDAVCSARAVFVAGAGRSMLMLRCLAMRLMHLGLVAHVVGDTTTPAFGKGDLLVCASGSGTTGSVLRVARRAHELGGSVAALTIEASSPLGELADVVVEISAYTDKRVVEGAALPTMPGGSLFEQSVLLLGDALVPELAARIGVPCDRAFALHANLE